MFSKNNSNENTNKRAETIMLFSTLIKIVFAIMIILLITWMFSGIWQSFFPSSDKATQKSFDELFSLIQSKAVENQPYDSNKFLLTLKSGYQIIYFGKEDATECAGIAQTKKYIQKPSDCEQNKACMCLYTDQKLSYTLDELKSLDTGEKNKDLLKCAIFDSDINLKDFDLNTNDCARANTNQFINLIVAEKTTQSQQASSQTSALPGAQNNQNSRIVYVWADNDARRQQDTAMKIPVCSQTSDPLCVGIAQNAYIDNQNSYDSLLTQCALQGKKTITAQCIFDSTLNKCTLSCKNNIRCGKSASDPSSDISSCEDYNKYSTNGLFNNEFVTKDSPAYWACLNDDKLCGVDKNTSHTKCGVSPLNYYYCNEGLDKCQNYFDNTWSDSFKTACKIKDQFPINNGFAITYTDSAVQIVDGAGNSQTSSCYQIISNSKFSDIAQSYTYNANDHQVFVQNTALMTKCGFYVSSSGLQIISLSPNDAECKQAISDYLVPLYWCSSQTVN